MDGAHAGFWLIVWAIIGLVGFAFAFVNFPASPLAISGLAAALGLLGAVVSV